MSMADDVQGILRGYVAGDVTRSEARRQLVALIGNELLADEELAVADGVGDVVDGDPGGDAE